MISLNLRSLSISRCSWVVWQMVWKSQLLERFLGHLKHVIIQRSKLSLMGIMYLKEMQAYSVLRTFALKKWHWRLLHRWTRQIITSNWWVSAPEISYNCINGLPVAKGIAGVCGPSGNLSLITSDNHHISMGKKTLLEWHYLFGDLGLQHVQFMLRQFPVVSPKIICGG